MTDLRSFIEKVRQEFPEDVLTIKKEMDPRFEIATLVVKLEQERRFPILLFENVKGSKFPVVTNVHASRRRLAAPGEARSIASTNTSTPYLRRRSAASFSFRGTPCTHMSDPSIASSAPRPAPKRSSAHANSVCCTTQSPR